MCVYNNTIVKFKNVCCVVVNIIEVLDTQLKTTLNPPASTEYIHPFNSVIMVYIPSVKIPCLLPHNMKARRCLVMFKKFYY